MAPPTGPFEESLRLSDLRTRVGDLAAFAGSVGRLLRGVLTDPRVPRSAKAVALAGAGYALSPIDLVPDVLPAIGLLDDLWIVRRSLRYLIDRAGLEVVADHWDGTDQGFDTLLFVAGTSR